LAFSLGGDPDAAVISLRAVTLQVNFLRRDAFWLIFWKGSTSSLLDEAIRL
jgi:hypothetical protein